MYRGTKDHTYTVSPEAYNLMIPKKYNHSIFDILLQRVHVAGSDRSEIFHGGQCYSSGVVILRYSSGLHNHLKY